MNLVLFPKLREAVAEDRPFRERALLAAFAAAVPSFTLTIFGPLDLFFGNTTEFAFALTDVLGALLICFFALLCALAGLCLILRGKLFNIAVSLLCMLGFCLYVQGTFLNGNIGIMDGSVPNWIAFGKRAYLDTLIWILLFTVPTIIRYFSIAWWKRAILFIACLTLCMQLAGLVSAALRPESAATETTFLMSKNGEFSLSKQKNAVVFIIDTFDINYLDAVLAESPGYLDDFTGFTYYHNNAGVHSRTCPSVPQLLSGKVFRYEKPYFEEYLPDVWAGGCLPRVLSEADFDVRLYAWDTLFTKESLSCVNNLIPADAASRDALFRNDPKPLAKMLLQLSVYRSWPHVLKPVVWVDGGALLENAKEDSRIPIDNADYYAIDDFQFYDNLRETGVTADCKDPAFRLYHLRGTHNPYDMNENAERVPTNSSSDVRLPAKGELTIVRNYLEQMRSAGVYDDTVVIIIADHGEVHDDYESVGSPILLVKPLGATGAFTRSDAPTSLLDVSATILHEFDLANNLPGTPVQVLDANTPRERLFYLTGFDANSRDLNMTEYRIIGDVNDKKNWIATGNSYPATYPCY